MMNYMNEIINRKYKTNKGYIYFIDLIKEQYPTFNINEDNVKNLSIIDMNEEYFSETGFVGEYVAKRNEIKILRESKNYKFSEEELIDTFLHELIHSLTSKISGAFILEGINQRIISTNQSSLFLGLNEGITQYIVNDLLGRKSDAYPFEVAIASQLFIILGKDKLIECYSNNNIEHFINNLKALDLELDEYKFITDIYYMSLIVHGVQLDMGVDHKITARKIQKQLLNLYLKSSRKNDQLFINSMMDEQLFKQVAQQNGIIYFNNEFYKEFFGFVGIEEVKSEFISQVIKNKK